MHADLDFGETLRAKRMALAESDSRFSGRKVAERGGIEPSYLSKIERGEPPAPGGQNIRRLAEELGEDPNTLLARAGKGSNDLREIIRERPTEVAELLRAVRRMSAKRVAEISRQIRDGGW